ncbi:MAG: hypothetical protein ACREXS_06245 [Gammaproteobacteria bacterium]
MSNIAQSWGRSALGALQSQGFSGSLRTDYFSSDKALTDETDLFGISAQAKVLPTFTDNLDGKLEVRLSDFDVVGGHETDATLLEAYLSLHNTIGQVRLGKQIVAWGRADRINPTDNLTPRDFTVLLPFEEDQRFGTYALMLDTYLSDDLTLEVFTTPFFEPSIIPFSRDEAIVVDIRPAHRLSNSEVAIKLDKSGGQVDWSLSYFHGYSLFPDIRLQGFADRSPIVEFRYHQMDVLGADIATNFGRYGFRAEAAYFHAADRDGTDPTIKNPYLFYVVGVDRTFYEHLNVNVQLFGRHVRHFTSLETIADPVQHEVAVVNAIVNGQQDEFSNGASMRVSNRWLNDTLEAELLGILDFTRSNTYLRPLLTYALTDDIRCSLGGELYLGADNTFFGRLKENSGLFFELRYSF